MKLSKTQKKVLSCIAQGDTLKSHRHLDGSKGYKLHPLQGPAKTVRWTTVEALKIRGLIDSNKKFPAATYLLTEKGKQSTSKLSNQEIKPLFARNY